MRALIIAAVILSAGSACADPAQPVQTYAEGICEGYRAALTQLQSGNKLFGAFLAQSQLSTETKGWVATGLNVMLFGQLDGHVADQNCNTPG